MKTANQILLEKRSNLVNGEPRGQTGDLSGAPLSEDSDVYWKSVTKDEPVSKEGGTFYAKMPDGKKKVTWKPSEKEQAKKHLQGLMGKKESLQEAKDPREEAAALSGAVQEFIKNVSQMPPKSRNSMAVSTMVASQAMKLYNLAMTLSRKLGEPRLSSLAKETLPKYWEGVLPYSKNQKMTPAERRDLGK